MELRAWWILLVVLGIVTAQHNPCTVKQTCHECIQTPTCAWCAQPEGFEDQNRCFQPGGNNYSSQCDSDYTVNLDNEYKEEQAWQLSKGRSGPPDISSSAVQITPQRISLKLRINQPFKINMLYTQAEDYPVDLYYLMDLSHSMLNDKENLATLGDLLATRMQNITSNFRLGFGSFVDKIVMPYVNTVPAKLKVPSAGSEAPYGFRNHMKLTTDTRQFSREVHAAAISGNQDDPEGGFDAIMQAVVCREQIGWRSNAHRLLLVSTDAIVHNAGDTKLGGIVKPNDGLCHLNNDGLYTHSTLQDSPSISQINLKVKENAINIIFAVTKDRTKVYDELTQHIEGSTWGTLTSNSSNVVDLVQDQYNKIKSSVEMKHTASSAVKVTYWTKCLDETGPLVQTNKCDGLQVGSVVEFQVEVEVKSCPKNPKEWNQTFMIYPVGINESLTVDLHMLCACPCELSGHKDYKEQSENCSHSGTYKCGVCECDSSRYGRKCECGGNNLRSGDQEAYATAGCRPDNTTIVDCSGRGTCVCGQCECEIRPNPEENIFGAYCECDNFSCANSNGLLCSGPDHGTCVCGKCVCAPGWTGESCDCRATNETCIPPGGGEICNGRGECECGKCNCTKYEQYYNGRYCEKCRTCPLECNELKNCVECKMYKTGILNVEDCATNCTFELEKVEKVSEREDLDEHFCRFYDEDDCQFSFVYSYDEKDNLIIRAEKEKECPVPVNIVGKVTSVLQRWRDAVRPS